MNISAARRVYSLVLVMGIACVSLAARHSPKSQAPTGPPTDMTVCAIAASPDAFDHKLLRFHAFISIGFEDSTLHDPDCPEEALVNSRAAVAPEPRIWIELGDYIGYEKVAGYAPLVNDDNLKQLQDLLVEHHRTGQLTGATMVGTFYAGKRVEINGRKSALRGYGQMGCCSLFVLSRVESVDTRYWSDLNYSPWNWHVGMPPGCYQNQMLGLPTNETLLIWQQGANDGHEPWRYDAKRTAEEELRKLKSGPYGSMSGGTTSVLVPDKQDLSAPPDTRPTETFLETLSTPSRKVFEWIEPDHTTHYVIVVTRPYWLLKTAGTPDQVIWAPTGASVLKCGLAQVQGKKHQKKK